MPEPARTAVNEHDRVVDAQPERRGNARLENAEDIGNVVLTTRGGVPVFLKDVAEVGIGRELRTGSASENGNEVGTAMMLKGRNSRIVAGVKQNVRMVTKGMMGGLAWPGLLRKLDRLSPSYKD